MPIFFKHTWANVHTLSLSLEKFEIQLTCTISNRINFFAFTDAPENFWARKASQRRCRTLKMTLTNNNMSHSHPWVAKSGPHRTTESPARRCSLFWKYSTESPCFVWSITSVPIGKLQKSVVWICPLDNPSNCRALSTFYNQPRCDPLIPLYSCNWAQKRSKECIF